MAKKKWRYVKTGPLSGYWVYGSSDEELDNKADTVQQVDTNRGVAPEDSSKGFLGSIFSNIGEALLGEGFSELNLGESLKSWLDSMSGAELTNAQKQQNDFEANQAQINRDFQSKEAELAFERQIDFYEEYQSIGAQMRQYRENGLNPALLAGGVSPSASGGSSPAAQGSAAHSSSVSSNPMALVSFVMQLLGKKVEIDNMKKQGQKIDAETQNIKEGTKLTTQQVVESVARVNNLDANTLKVADERAKIAKDIAVSDADIALKEQQVATLISQSVLNEKQGNLIVEQTELTKKEQKKLDYVIEDLIYETKLTKHEIAIAKREYYALIQEYGHQEVMNSIVEISSSRDAGVGEHSNGYYRVTSEVKRFVNTILGWFSGGAVLSIKK